MVRIDHNFVILDYDKHTTQSGRL